MAQRRHLPGLHPQLRRRNGDGVGVGDIAGIRSRLPYLKALGVDAIWINPWYKSPMADHGYDVADYRAIDPLFGTVAEAEQLIEEAHRHGLRVIPDIVPNHTSDQHVWFQAALAAGPGSPERERYVLRPGRGPDGAEPPNDWVSAFGGPAWTRLPDGEWCLHLFAPEQPDLNWEHPEVRTEFESTLRFSFSRGVDGFRIDVAHGLIKHPELPTCRPALPRRQLHDIIQAAFGWEDYHMWAFETGQDRYGIADCGLGIRSAASKRLDQVAPSTGNRLRYTYDFGDDWEHDIVVEDVTGPEPGTVYPRCLTGRRACPPEDSGGVWGYEYLIEILADPRHEEHEDRLEWLGLDSADQFDPAAFDAAQVNSALSALATVMVKN